MTDQNNALIVGIAQIIDYPSVYMGGPSRNSLRIAETIVKEFGADLARADRAAPEALEHLRNVMGHIDTPIARRHLRINEDQPEWLTEAREFLAALPLETNGE